MIMIMTILKSKVIHIAN